MEILAQISDLFIWINMLLLFVVVIVIFRCLNALLKFAKVSTSTLSPLVTTTNRLKTMQAQSLEIQQYFAPILKIAGYIIKIRFLKKLITHKH